MKILKNFKLLKTGGYEEYPAIQIRMDDTEVFVDLPICMVDFNGEIESPLLVGYNNSGIGIVIEKEELIEKLGNTKKIFFEIVNGVPEITKGETEIFTRLPKDDDENKYIYDYRGGTIYIIERMNEGE